MTLTLQRPPCPLVAGTNSIICNVPQEGLWTLYTLDGLVFFLLRSFLKRAAHERYFFRIDFGSDDTNRDSSRLVYTHGALSPPKTNAALWAVT